MNYFLIVIFSLLIRFSIVSQSYVSDLNKVKPDVFFNNIHVKKLSSDINATTFAIWVKQRVKIHKHVNHVENIYVSEGRGIFQLEDSIFNINSGDIIVVPKNTWHGVIVNSKKPLKVLSIQSPEFIGNDRVFKN